MDYLRSIIVWLAGIAFLIIFFPIGFIIWLFTFPFDSKRQVVHSLLIFQSLVLVHIMPVWKIKTEGREKAVKGQTYVILSNHQSILDILVVNCLRYRFKWISKAENTRVPVLGWYLRMAGYLTVDRSDRESKDKLIADAYDCLKNGNSIMIFPEGTRSPDREIKPFKRGAFQLAISANVPILPVVIDGTGDVLPKHGLIFGGFHRVSVKVLDPVFPETFPTKDPEELAVVFRDRLAAELSDLRRKMNP